MYNITNKTVLSHDFWNWKRSHELYDKTDKDYSLRVCCVQIQNCNILCPIIPAPWFQMTKFISQASKRRAASKSVDGFPRLGSCSIWMVKTLNSRAVYKRTFRGTLICKQSVLVGGGAWGEKSFFRVEGYIKLLYF